jgi:two-component system, chemotaxis family, chemotaxis protein CheY
MKALIVDDSSFIMLICRQTLEKAGIEVVGEAYDGLEAIEKASKLKPDLVILDIALPKKNGFEVSQYIHDILPETHILAISAIEEDWVKKKVLEAGCFNFLAKPFETSELINILNFLKSSKKELKYG